MHFRWMFILLFFCSIAQAQENEVIREWIENLSADLPEDLDVSEVSELLTRLNKHKIDLNTNTEDLKQLFFITPLQISNLMEHIKKNGPLLNVVELQAVPTFDLLTVHRLLPFVEVSSPTAFKKMTIKGVIDDGENELLIRYGRVLDHQKGFSALSGSHYLGNPDKALLKYAFRYRNLIVASITLEKDAGERYFSQNNRKFYDFASGSIYGSKLGVVEKIVLGDYSLQFGQGLTLWSGFSFGKGADVSSIIKNSPGLKSYSSANEYSFFRGIAATVKIAKGMTVTPFYSHRNMDAAISPSATGDNVFTTISQTGLHRTANEQLNEGSLPVRVIGGAIQYTNTHFTTGLTVVNTVFGHTAELGNALYRSFDFIGKSLTNAGINYSYSFRNLYIFGEVAMSFPGKIASINGMIVSLSPTVSASLLYRDYNKSYHNYFAQVIGEGSDGNNEIGLFTGVNVTPNKYWNISVYTDYFKFPWLKYRIDAPSNGNEIVASVGYFPNKKTSISLRYKANIKEQNTDAVVPINYLESIKKESYRLNVKWAYGVFAFQNGVEFARFKKGVGRPEYGGLFYQDIAAAPLSTKISGNLRLALFKTDTFDSRIYAYERDVLYGYSSGMYNGTGLRIYLNLRFRPFKKLTFWSRYLISYYPKEEAIGSSLDEIDGKKRQEIKLQMRYQF